MGVSKVVYGNQTLIDISGDTVTPETLMNGYTAHDASGAAIVGNASGGGGSGTSKNVMYDLGNYFGTPSSSQQASSLSFATSGHVGKKAIVVVLHRDDITLDNAWTLIAKKNNPTDSSHPITQFVSVYEKIVATDSESYTITQNTATWLLAFTLYLDAQATLSFKETVEVEASNYRRNYSFGRYDKDTLCILSSVVPNYWRFTSTPRVCLIDYYTDTLTQFYRPFLGFINPSLTEMNIELYRDSSSSYSDGQFYDKFFIFDINMPLRQGLLDKTITENGTYDPLDEGYEGYGEVTVNVNSGGDLSRYITALDSYGEIIGQDDFAMHIGNYEFNRPILIGDNVTNCYSLLSSISTFNSSITFGNNVTNCASMLYGCSNYNQPITLPDSLIDCSSMLAGATKFRLPITIPSNVQNCGAMFNNLTAYNNAVTFEATNIRYANNIFNNCRAFNQPVYMNTKQAYLVSSFDRCIAFDKPVTFNGTVCGMNKTFNGCTIFNQPLDITFSTYQNCYCNELFTYANNFNSAVSFHEVDYRSGCYINFDSTFNKCQNLNQPVTFDVQHIMYISSMFNNCVKFNQPIELNFTNCNYASNAFRNCGALNQKLNFNFNKPFYPLYANHMFYQSPDVYGDFYFINGYSHFVTSMFYGTNGQKRKNCYCNTLTRFLWTNANSIVGQTITWTAMDNGHGYYNDSFNIYLYNQW